MRLLRLELLSRREREVIDALLGAGNRASVDDLLTQLDHRLTYSAVRAVLAGLERKDYVRHVENDGRYIYSVRQSPAAVARRAVERHVSTFFEGSRTRMITSLLRQGSWTDDELRSLQDEIARARQRVRRKGDSS